MSVKDKLQIILITYNRAKHVQKTFEQFFCEGSPVRDCDFIVQDNNSTDNTHEIVADWQKKYPNIKYSKNKYNLGISGNIARAMEVADKDYAWIIGDDDKFDWSNWQEVENAINNNEKVICVARYVIPDKYKQEISYQLFQLTFITGGIYSTQLFNDTTIKNAFDNIYTLFPHLAPIVSHINAGKKIYVVDKAISDNGMDIKNTDCSYIRGAKNLDDVYTRTKTMSWIVGYCNILSNLKDENLKHEAIKVAIPYKDIYGNYENFYNHMKTYQKDNIFMQWIDVYLNVDKNMREQLKTNYLATNISENCDLFQMSYYDILRLLLLKIKNTIFSLEKTEEKRYLTILGIKIVTRRKKTST